MDEKWELFEKQVMDLFDIMGYKVERNRSINNRQIDLYAEKNIPPDETLKVAIECKDQQTNVSLVDVDRFLLKIRPSLDDRTIHKGFIITSSDFSKDAKEFARKYNITCMTYLELIGSLANFKQYINMTIEKFEKDEVFHRYIELEGIISEGKEENDLKSIENYLLNNWVRRGKTNHISILGEYGSGKTTLCNMLAYELAKAYKSDPINNRIPILINLRDYSKAMNLKQLITDLLVNTHRIQNMTNSIFLRMNEYGKFVLIFDGFDEMAQRVDMNTTVRNFNELAQTAIPDNSKVILTCRTEYFRSDIEEREILSSEEGKYINLSTRPNFAIVHLKPFSLEKIRKFLIKVNKTEAEQWFNQIRETYNLFELSQRPVLLDMIVKSIKQLSRIGGSINAGRLYDIYTDEWIQRDIASGRTMVTKEMKKDFVMTLANTLYFGVKSTVHFSEIPTLVKKQFELQNKTEVDFYEHDCRLCTYLIRDNNGYYTFVHKSFMEFFVAKNLTESIYKNNVECLDNYLNSEITHFIANLCDAQHQFNLNRYIESSKNGKEQDVRFKASNAITILNYLGYSFIGKDLSNLYLPSCDLSRPEQIRDSSLHS